MLPTILSNFSLHTWLPMALLITLAAFLQGVGGVGFAMFVAPVAAAFFPELVPGTLLALGGGVSLLAALRERHHIQKRLLGSALVGRLVGSVFAVLAMTHLSGASVNYAFASMILIAVVLSAAGLSIRPSGQNLSFAGIASGVMGTLTSVGAPALAIVMQNLAAPQLRATMGMTLFIGASFSILMLVWAGLFTLEQAVLSVLLYPFMLLGFALSNRVRHKVSMALMRRLLLLFCTLSALGLILRTLYL